MMKHFGKLLTVVSLIFALSACAEMSMEESPSSLYDHGEDEQALASAKKWLDTKYDLSVRLFIVQYELARYLETGDPSHADEIAKYYGGASTLKDPSRWHQAYDELIWLAKYFDAAILLHVKQDKKAALALLDSYCPMPEYEKKVRCHVKNYWYFEGGARSGYDRNSEEAAFLADLTVGLAYDDPKMIGHALELQAGYDVKHASERAAAYSARNAFNDDVMKGYCKPLDDYRHYGPDTEHYTDYMAAYERANCAAYIPVDQEAP